MWQEGGRAVPGSTVSVIVPTYNRAELIDQTLQSLLRQTRPPDEILVVDDGSTDSTQTVVAQFGPRVGYVHRANGGKPAALNTGLAKVTGTYTWILDDDDIALPDAVERYTRALDLEPTAGYSFGTYLATRPMPSGRTEMGEVVCESTVPPFENTTPLIALMEGNYLGGARLFVRTECYRVLGGYDERYKRSEDYEMPIRLARRWNGVRASGGATYLYRQHEGLRGHAEDRFTMSENDARFREYDGMLFRELLRDMKLPEFVGKESITESLIRQAYLQRLSLAVIHRVAEYIPLQLRQLAEDCDGTPFNTQERAVLERLVKVVPGLWTPREVGLTRQVQAWVRYPAGKRLRFELARVAVQNRLSPGHSMRARAGTAARAASMFLPR